jgi:organic radical activating enzyme
MNISSKRFGFACNSSSTHSCVVLKQGVDVIDSDTKDYYGWSHFTITSKETIKRYLYLMLYNQVTDYIDKYINELELDWEVRQRLSKICLAELLPSKILESFSFNLEGELEGEVDHQSALVFPSKNRTSLPDFDFAIDLIEEITNTPKIAILGGNDNDDKVHPLTKQSKKYNHEVLDILPKDRRKAQWLRYDKLGFYSIFDSQNGNKVRGSFNKNFKLTHSSIPELVDLKITDYCDKGCKFCYQSSTAWGQHADFLDIITIIKELAKLGCFEIAIGGGEPTQHPDIVEILKEAKKNNIVANITTKSQSWLSNFYFAKFVIELTGAIALSISTLNELNIFLSLIELLSSDGLSCKNKFTVQCVLGTIKKSELKKIMARCKEKDLPITLLGFKDVGFGEDYKIIPYDNWVDDLIKNSNQKISIDSKLLAERESFLIAEGFDAKFLTDKEGLFSCYIDALDCSLSRDSYSSNRGKYSIRHSADFCGIINEESILRAYEQMQLHHHLWDLKAT